jgi:hypothetical protein
LGSSAKLASQSLMAVQELGMVIGVALIVAVLFFLMIFVEKVWNSTTGTNLIKLLTAVIYKFSQ